MGAAILNSIQYNILNKEVESLIGSCSANMSKNKKKQVPLPPRPAIPYVNQIVEDIRNADINDVAFCNPNKTHIKRTVSAAGSNSGDDLNSLMIESFEDPTMDAESCRNYAEVDVLFQKVEQFISSNKQLENAPETLKQQNEHLTKVSQQLSETVEELRNQATISLSQS
ncbi:uncharacterized protein LOC141909119 [Tubulanus polymorphus]|uniref:uncharacterized protein LOC141909119 n=1 Tax=Tubulanus polymorphus TaxID=672921 RepID=UPI003DA3EA25